MAKAFNTKYFNKMTKPFHYAVFYADESNLTIENWHHSLKHHIENTEEDIWVGNILDDKQTIIVSFGSWDMFFYFTAISSEEANNLKLISEQHAKINWQNKIELWLDTEYDENLLEMNSTDFPEINKIIALAETYSATYVCKI